MNSKIWTAGVALLCALALLGGCAPRAKETDGSIPSSVPSSSQKEQISSSSIESLASPQPETSSEEESASQQEESVQNMDENQEESSPIPEDEGKTEDWMLILANDTHPIGEYAPELGMVQDPYQMDVRVVPIMLEMMADAKAQGVDLLICSAYRPYSSQERNFNNSVNNYIAQGYSEEQARSLTKRLIMEPGKSEHQTGLAADIVTPSYQMLDEGYAQTEAAQWLAAHAPEYGFILRYPKDKTEITGIDYEPWHFRYVGVEAAMEITEKGLCLEEYLEEQDG